MKEMRRQHKFTQYAQTLRVKLLKKEYQPKEDSEALENTEAQERQDNHQAPPNRNQPREKQNAAQEPRWQTQKGNTVTATKAAGLAHNKHAGS